MDGGIGESMLLGAALSAGTGLISGRGIDPLSVLTGAGTGALGGYLFGGGPSSALASEGTPAADQTMRMLEGQTLPGLSSGAAGTQLGMANADMLKYAGAGGYDTQFMSPWNQGGQFLGTTASQAPLASGITGLQGGIGPNMGYIGTDAAASAASTAPSLSSQVTAGEVQSALPTATSNVDVSSPAAQSKLSSLGDSLKQAGSDVRTWWNGLDKTDKMLIAGAGGIGALALMQPEYKQPQIPQTNAPQFGLAANYAAVPNPTPVYPKFAEGGIASLASGGMNMPAPANVDFMGGDMYPQSQQQRSFYATPTQMPTSAQQAMASYEPKTNPLTGTPTANMAHGGIANLGSYSDGGQMLRGPGDGMSDSIPASIGRRQPARLADGEFVVPADVVSHLGNGSTDAGAKQLYGMMDKVRKARTGNKRQGKQINPKKYMPA